MDLAVALWPLPAVMDKTRAFIGNLLFFGFGYRSFLGHGSINRLFFLSLRTRGAGRTGLRLFFVKIVIFNVKLLFFRLSFDAAIVSAELTVKTVSADTFAEGQTEKRKQENDEEQKTKDQRAGITERTDHQGREIAADKAAALMFHTVYEKAFNIIPSQSLREGIIG